MFCQVITDSKMPLFFGLLGIFLMSASLAVVLAITFFRKHAKAERQKEELQKQYGQMLLQSQLEIKEQTLQDISNELHDNLGQIASLIKINLNTLQLDDIATAREKIDDTKELTRKLIFDLKLISLRLGSSGITQTGIGKALEKEVAYLNKTGQFTAHFIQEGVLPLFDNDKTIILFRMSQEILHNSIKHSNASQITVSLKSVENVCILEFNDDGIGFDLHNTQNTNGAGLGNLQNRAALINAKMVVHSAAGNGTRIIIELPL